MMVTFDEVRQLRREIVLNSLYISDYENSLGYDPHDVCDFFDGYVGYLAEIMERDRFSVDAWEYFDVLWSYDTDENLEDWYGCFENLKFRRVMHE